MLAMMLQDFVCELEAQVEQWAQELWRTLDLAKLEEELSERMQRLYAGVVGQVLTELLSEPSYLEALRRLGGRRGMRLKEYRRVRVLGRRGIGLDVKTLRRLCRDMGEQGLPHRGVMALTGSEELQGQTLVIGIDGGRLRERRPKRGRKQGGQKHPEYHTEWKEPKLFTLYLLDAQGQIVKEFAPLHDGTM